jgi:hypothetical protein
LGHVGLLTIKITVISDYKVCQYPLIVAYYTVRIEPVEMLFVEGFDKLSPNG